MKVALYARVSKEDGQNPENQLSVLRDLAARRGYFVVGEYTDHASGKDPNRPKFAQLMEAARRHEFDAILALRVDRMMRSTIHLLAVMQNLKAYNVRLVFSDFEYDPSSPFSDMLLTFLSGIAEFERNLISARTKEGLALKKSKGVILGRTPRTDIPLIEIATRRAEGWGWKRIADTYGIPKTTLLDRRAEINAIVHKSENVPTIINGSEKEGGV